MSKKFDFELILDKNPAMPFTDMRNILRIKGAYFKGELNDYWMRPWDFVIESMCVESNWSSIDIWPYFHQIFGFDLSEESPVFKGIMAHIEYLEQSKEKLIDGAADGH